MYSFGSTYTKIGTIQRRLAWPLRKDDTQNREAFHIFGAALAILFILHCNFNNYAIIQLYNCLKCVFECEALPVWANFEVRIQEGDLGNKLWLSAIYRKEIPNVLFAKLRSLAYGSHFAGRHHSHQKLLF